jgi:uncharacterized membrane protein
MSGYSVPEFHGAITHFPIAFIIAVLIFDLGAAIFKKEEWKVVSFWLLVAAVVSSVPTYISGLQTANALYGKSPSIPSIAAQHRLYALVASVVALLVLLLRAATKDKAKGATLGLSWILTLIMVSTISYAGFLGGKMVFGSDMGSPVPPPSAPGATTASSPHFDPALVLAGSKDFAKESCDGCHAINGVGAKTGPNLTQEGMRHNDVAWQIKHLKDPTSTNPNSSMPPYNTLSDKELNELATYMSSLK